MSGYIGSKRSSSLVSFDDGTIGSGVVFPAGHVLQVQNSYSTTATQKTLTTSYAAINTSVTLSNLTAGNKIHIQYFTIVDTEDTGGTIYTTVYVDSTTDLSTPGSQGATRTQDVTSLRFVVAQSGFANFTATSSSHTFTIYAKNSTAGTIRDDFIKSQITAMEIQV